MAWDERSWVDEHTDPLERDLVSVPSAMRVGEVLTLFPVADVVGLIARFSVRQRTRLAASDCGSLAVGVLAQDEDPVVRRVVAASLSIDVNTQSTLAMDPDTGVRSVLAENTTLAPDVLQLLVADLHPLVRRRCAARDDLQSFQWRVLAADSDPMVVRQLANNSLRPPRASLIILSNPHATRNALLAAANDPGLSWAELAPLLNSDAPVFEVLANPQAPHDVMREVLADSVARADERAKARIEMSIASNDCAPPDLLFQVWNQAGYWTRLTVVTNSAAPPEIASEVLRGPEGDLRGALIRNGKISTDQLYEITRSDALEEERSMAAERLYALTLSDIEESWLGTGVEDEYSQDAQ